MRIKSLDINRKKLYFNKTDNIVFVKENIPFGSRFIDGIRTVFCPYRLDIDGITVREKKIKCVLEKYGMTFTVSVNIKERPRKKEKNVAGCGGSFSMIGTFKPQKDLSPEIGRLLRLFKADMKEFLMPSDIDRELAFYDAGMTATFTDNFIMYSKLCLENALEKDLSGLPDNLKQTSEEYLLRLKARCDAIDKFIKDFQKIDMGEYSLGFDKKTNEFKAFGECNEEEMNTFCENEFYNFLTANKLLEAVKNASGENELPPIFLYNVFGKSQPESIKKHFEELRELNRQVFIIENKDIPYLENLCDKKITMENNNEEIGIF